MFDYLVLIKLVVAVVVRFGYLVTSPIQGCIYTFAAYGFFTPSFPDIKNIKKSFTSISLVKDIEKILYMELWDTDKELSS